MKYILSYTDKKNKTYDLTLYSKEDVIKIKKFATQLGYTNIKVIRKQ